MPLGLASCFIAGAVVCGFFARSFERAVLASGYVLFGLISSGFLIKIFKAEFTLERSGGAVLIFPIS